MLKNILLLGFLMSGALLPTKAQKSTYASRPVGTAHVLPQYQMTLGNRLGEGSTEAPPKPTDATTLQDLQLLQQVASWPKDKQPFWFLNSGYIKNQRGQSGLPSDKLPSEQNFIPTSTVTPSTNPPTIRVRSFRGHY